MQTLSFDFIPRLTKHCKYQGCMHEAAIYTWPIKVNMWKIAMNIIGFNILNALLQITKHYDFPFGSVLRKQICAIIAKQLCFQVAWLELKNKWDHISFFSFFLFFLSLFVSVSLSVSLPLSSSLPTLFKSSGNALQDIGWQTLRAPFQYWQCYEYHLQYGS